MHQTLTEADYSLRPDERCPEMEALGFELSLGFFGFALIYKGSYRKCYDSAEEAWAVVRRLVRLH